MFDFARQHPVWSLAITLAIFFVWTLPAWLGAVWPLFSTKTLPQWLSDRGRVWNMTPTFHLIMTGILTVIVVAVFVGVLTLVVSREKQGDMSTTQTELVTVAERTFRNERIVLDGHSYTDCTFINVTFEYNGGRFVLSHNQINGAYIVSKDNRITAAWKLIAGLGLIKDGVRIDN